MPLGHQTIILTSLPKQILPQLNTTSPLHLHNPFPSKYPISQTSSKCLGHMLKYLSLLRIAVTHSSQTFPHGEIPLQNVHHPCEHTKLYIYNPEKFQKTHPIKSILHFIPLPHRQTNYNGGLQAQNNTGPYYQLKVIYKSSINHITPKMHNIQTHKTLNN